MAQPNATVSPPRALIFVADDGGGVGVEPLGEGEFIGDSVEGTTGDDAGLLTGDCDLGGDRGDIGECMGSEGTGVARESCGGVGGVSADGGAAGGGAEVASVSISTFIPWLQCPIVPQMKYLFPREERGTAVLPPV